MPNITGLLAGLSGFPQGLMEAQQFQQQQQLAAQKMAIQQLAMQQEQEQQRAQDIGFGYLTQAQGLPQMQAQPMPSQPSPQIPMQTQSPLPLVPPAAQQMAQPGGVRGSWFGNYQGAQNWSDPSDSGLQASGRPVSAGPGIALPSRSTLGQQFAVTAPSGQSYIAPQTDVGPAAKTGRGVDINAPLAEEMGYTPQTFPTDATFKVAALNGQFGVPGAAFVRQGAPVPAVQGAAGIAGAAAGALPSQQFGMLDISALAKAIDQADPDAPGHVKMMALGNIIKLAAPEERLAYQQIMQQNRQAFQMEMLNTRLTQQRSEFDTRLAQQQSQFDQRLAQRQDDAGTPKGGSMYQPTDEQGKPVGQPVWVAQGKATPISGLPEGAVGGAKVGTKPLGQSNVSDLQAEWVANYIQATGTWPVGSGRNQQLQNKVEQILGQKGVDPKKIAQAAGSFKSDQASLAQATKLADATTSYEQTARKNLDIATKQIHAVAPTDWGPTLNKWIETGETFAGDPNVPASVAAVITLANEYAKVMSGATGAAPATDSARREAAATLNPYFSSGQWDAVVDKVIVPDMNNRIASLNDQVEIIRSRIGRGAAPGGSTAAAPGGSTPGTTQPVPDAFKSDPDGTGYLKDGKTWVKKGNQLILTPGSEPTPQQ